MRPSRGGALVAASLAAAVVATFAGALTPARVFYQRDVHAYWWPHAEVIRRAIAEGSWRPWSEWNPWEGFGAPVLPDANFQLAYPVTWLTLGLEPALRFKVLAIGHALLAALGACALARRLGPGWTAAGTAGAAYALSGPFLSAATLWHHYAGAAWLPWLLFALEGLIRAPRPAAALSLGIVAGLQLMAGSGDLCLAGAILGGGRLAWCLVRRRPPAARALVLAANGALAAALALALGAAQWLPTLERARESFRTVLDARTNAYWSLHPAALADLLVPRLATELPLSEAARQALHEGREPFLACLYLGVVPLALAALGLALRARRAAAPAAGALFLVVVALGRHAPLHRWLLALPVFGMVRYPQKFLWPAALCVALLAALGLAAWETRWSDPERRRVRVLCGLLLAAAGATLVAAWWVGGTPAGLAPLLDPPEAAAGAHAAALKLLRSTLLLLAVALLAWRRANRKDTDGRATAALLVLGAADLVAVGQGVNPLAPRELMEHRPAVVDALAGEETRLHAASEDRTCLVPGTQPAGWDRRWIAALGFQDALRPPSGARWGLRGSYDGEFTGLGSLWTAPFTAATWSRLGTPAGLRLLQIGGVTHVLAVSRSPVPGLGPAVTLPTPYACPLQVQRVPDPLPGAYVVHAERAGADPGAVLDAVLDPAFDPRREVVLGAPQAAGPATPSPDDVRVVSRSLSGLEVEALLAAPGVLVVLEAFDTGWRATVDGAEAEVLRANGLFRAVRLSAGRHRVAFAYRPRSAATGAALTLLGLAAAAGGLGGRAVAAWRERRVQRARRAIAGAPLGG
jgi:membrane protein YfhO